MEWPKAIATLRSVHSLIAHLDVEIRWPIHPPEPPATEDQLLACERALGVTLDRKYRAFLTHANGWRGFYQTVDLFGTDELVGGGLFDHARRMLQVGSSDTPESSRIQVAAILPIAATWQDRDLFVLSTVGDSTGQVIWLAGEEVDRFLDFEEFFLAMTDYNREELADLVKERGN